MGFVREYVPKEDWDLYNSFEICKQRSSEKKIADQNSCWVVDRERKIYIILTGVDIQEQIMSYTLIWRKEKVTVNIYSGKSRRGSINDVNKIYYEICGICLNLKLKGQEQEIIEIIKEFVQSETKKECIFEYISKITYNGEEK